MKTLIQSAQEYVELNIGSFHADKLASLKKQTLRSLLKRKNPYLFKAKFLISAPDFVKALLSAHISSSEETIFGDWLEGLAIYLNQLVYKGQKAPTKGVDLDFTRDGNRYLVAIKSSPNWGNSGQIEHLETKFKTALQTLRTSRSNAVALPVNGCCYGNRNADRGTYLIRSGQAFWELISGDDQLYIKIIEPLGHKAKEKNDEYAKEYAKIETGFTQQFITDYCKPDNSIDWEKIVELNGKAIIKAAPKAAAKKRVTKKAAKKGAVKKKAAKK